MKTPDRLDPLPKHDVAEEWEEQEDGRGGHGARGEPHLRERNVVDL